MDGGVHSPFLVHSGFVLCARVLFHFLLLIAFHALCLKVRFRRAETCNVGGFPIFSLLGPLQ